ncbi:hypothetical protein SCLCIDRAFT_287506 [Scleroderma citrinum Foug A]|uniref:Uncharacterized protein n=1 Tax=Scleroderma citrinum Foug A TaxID=1036808 RepID=A0A0C3DI70_9AGAM|nr:hypothetical protein SCLCIDRAFT_287506 [Scleroderma citrinum Foug A]
MISNPVLPDCLSTVCHLVLQLHRQAGHQTRLNVNCHHSCWKMCPPPPCCVWQYVCCAVLSTSSLIGNVSSPSNVFSGQP